MSLDVYLTMPGLKRVEDGSGIFVRESGQTREITRAEWEERFPGREPVVCPKLESEEVYSANITHNLRRMAMEAGIYDACWRPDECGITHAKQLVPILRGGLERLRSNPGRYCAFNPSNGWGTYEGFVPWVEQYLRACEENPNATVSVSR